MKIRLKIGLNPILSDVLLLAREVIDSSHCTLREICERGEGTGRAGKSMQAGVGEQGGSMQAGVGEQVESMHAGRRGLIFVVTVTVRRQLCA